jgi:hypothetical protein
MGPNLNLMMLLGSIFGDGLGSYISNAPYQTGADDLCLNWVDSQAILVPFPQLQHFPVDSDSEREILERERERGSEKERKGDYGLWKVMPFCDSVFALGLNIQMFLLSNL